MKNSSRRTASFATLFAILLLTGCGRLKETPTSAGGGSGEPIDPTATLTRLQTEVFTPTCATLGCHDALGREQGLLLTSGQSYGQTVNKPSTEVQSTNLVQPGDPTSSYLYRKVTGSNIAGDWMPQGRPHLSAAQLKLIRDWIRRGAPND